MATLSVRKTKTATARNDRFQQTSTRSTAGFLNALGLASMIAIFGGSSEAESAERAKKILFPRQARQVGLESLRRAINNDGGVPLPDNLDTYVKDRNVALALGKALFWDTQVGSDGLTACGSCHFHAGADHRTTNLLNPNIQSFVDQRADDIQGYFDAKKIADRSFQLRRPGETFVREDFPFVKTIQDVVVNSDGTVRPAAGNTNDIASSMGMFVTQFDGIQPGSPTDLGTPLTESVWLDANGAKLRRVEPRNAPSVINAVFNFTNFWEGRASPHFNGQSPFGDQDSFASVLVNDPVDGLRDEKISIGNASLASQALGPTVSLFEMSFVGRIFPDIGYKLLRPSAETGAPLTPLGQQTVDPSDSVLGPLSNAPGKGLNTSYETMIKQAFADRYWNSDVLQDGPNNVQYTQMEANFSLFFGLALNLYEATLVSDQSPFDQWMESGRFNRGFGGDELEGLNLFANKGNCIMCHSGPEFTSASVRAAQGGAKTIRAMPMAEGNTLYDNGFYNISVTPTTDDIGRGDRDFLGQPLAFSRQALFDRLNVQEIAFPIIGGEQIPAIDETGKIAVCDDQNGNGVCEKTETIGEDFRRVAVDGAFKTPGLRNTELTGPYFHNGGMATLMQVVQFYNRGGNFCRFNKRDLHAAIKPIKLKKGQEKQLVRFLLSLTDERVKYKRAPFDHPSIEIPEDGLENGSLLEVEAVGAKGTTQALKPFLDLNPMDQIFKPEGECSID